MADIKDVRLDINKCPLCGKAFVGVAGIGGVCENCKEEEQELYNELRALIRDNNDEAMSVEDASRRLGVAEHKIRYLVDRGLIQLVTHYGESPFK